MQVGKESADSNKHQESHASHGQAHQKHEHSDHSHAHGHGHSHELHSHGHAGQQEHAHHKHTGAAHANEGSDEFLASIRLLREAEKSAQSALEGARGQAASIEAQGREKAVEISAKAQEKAVNFKNEIISKGREETEKEVGSILNEAKKQAERIRAKRLLEREVSALSQSVL